MARKNGAVVFYAVAAIGLLAGAAQAGLVAHWTFDGVLSDQTGNHDATVAGGSPSYAAGKYGDALLLSGGGDYLTTNSDSDGLGMGGSFTAMAWIYSDVLSADKSVYGKDSGGNGNQLHLITRGDKAHLGFYGNDTGGNQVLSTGTWTHIAWQYNSTGGVQSIFVNGVRDASNSGRAALGNAGGNVLIGRWGGGNYFDGMLDDLVIYNEPLAPGQIQYVMNGGDPTHLPAVLNWDFGSGNLQGWTVLNGAAYLRVGDGDGVTPANSSGGYAHDGAHTTFLLESPEFNLIDPGVDGVSVLTVEFAGGAGDQNGAGMIFHTPLDVLAYNGGQSDGNGQKGLAFFNTSTWEYDAVIFENDNGGTNIRSFTMDDLIGLGVDPFFNYRLHYFENDQGGWGWGQLNWISLTAGDPEDVPEPATMALLGLAACGLGGYVRRRRTA